MYLGMWRPPGDHREQSTGAERLVRFRGGEGFCSSRATPGIHGSGSGVRRGSVHPEPRLGSMGEWGRLLLR